MKRLLLASLLLPAVTVAQTQTTKNLTLPTTIGVPSTNNLPIGEPQIHYQQWYAGNQFSATLKQPVRIIGIEFQGVVATGVVLDIQITMAVASTSLTGTFANNFVEKTLVVLPRTKITPPWTGNVLPIAFKNHWKYDGVSNVVMDIQIWGNGLGKSFAYAAQSTISRVSNTARQYYVGNPNATVANSSGATAHYGLVTKFLYQEGGTYEYGTGCPGGRGIEPVGSANVVPMPGLSSYTQHLDKAGSNYPAAFFIGISKEKYNGVNLPLALAFLGGSNCSMLAAPHLIVFTKTVGGGPGAGSAKLLTPVPAIGSLAGVKVYSQWIVFDLAAANGSISATKGLMHVVGS